MPELTIALVTYNRAPFLHKAIQAILDQTYRDFTLQILDNGSTDETPEIVRGFTDSRIIYIRHAKNIGAVNNGNYAIDDCTSKFLMITHDDDIMGPNLIEREMKVMADPQVNLVSSNMSMIDENDVPLPGVFLGIKEDLVYQQSDFIRQYVKAGNTIMAPTVILRNSILKQYGLRLNSNVGPENDAFLWSEMNLHEGKLVVLAEPNYKYRIHPGQDSALNARRMMVEIYNSYHLLLDRAKLFRFKKWFELKLLRAVLHNSGVGFENTPAGEDQFRKYLSGILSTLELSPTQSLLIKAMIRSPRACRFAYTFLHSCGRLATWFR